VGPLFVYWLFVNQADPGGSTSIFLGKGHEDGIAVGCSALLGFVVMFHSYDDISLLVPFVDIPVGLDNLFQRIAPVDDRFYLPCLDKLFEED